MKVVNTVKLKEEFDYESLCRKLETQVDHLSAEVDRQQKLRENEKNQMKKLLEEFENSSAKAEKSFAVSSEVFISVMLILLLHALKFSSLHEPILEGYSTCDLRFLCRVLNIMSG